jgi:PAS domain S-box-containing protein
MRRILFLCSKNDARSQMAAGFARARQDPALDIVTAGLEAGELHPMAVRVMGEAGVDIADARTCSLADLDDSLFDLVVTLSEKAAAACPMLIGNPPRVDWRLDDPDAVKGEDETVLLTFRSTRDHVRRLIDDLFDRGYSQALLAAARCEGLILDGISDGILVHDLNRKITFFNRAAQQITGYTAKDVLGKDCHRIFDGGFCGGKCLLPDGPCKVTEVTHQELQVPCKGGDRLILERSVRSMTDAAGAEVGAMVMFCDRTRERHLARQVSEVRSFAGILGQDEKMLEIFDLVRDLADSDVSVLIQGESGTGKELVAAAVHNEGPRANRLFVPVNCGALPENLLESELFGHVKGSFTGAIRDKKGRFELADGGTIFLDEIGDISPGMQVKLLRVLQEGTFERVGSEETQKVHVRVISATNKDLSTEIAAGRFREDLYYRLSVVPLWLPPLRDRRTDIPLLAEHVLSQALAGARRKDTGLSSEAMDLIMSYDWPGNVRELQNWIQFALVKCKGPMILPEHLPPMRTSQARKPTVRRRRKLDAETVRLALLRSGGNKVQASEILGVSRATLYRFLDDVEVSA